MHQLSRGYVDSDPLHIRVLYARHFVISDAWNDRGICSTYWRYYVNYRDGAAVRLHDGTLYPLPAGAVHFVPAWVPIDLVNTTPIPHLWAHFDIVGCPGTIIRELFPSPCSLPLDESLRQTSQAMRDLLVEGGAINRADVLFAAKAAIHCAFSRLLAGLSTSKLVRMSALTQSDAPLLPALRHIESHLAQSVRVEALARLCGYAEDHFARVFRRQVGQTPGQYVLERRVAMAAQQLVLTDASIEAIAQECGFPDRFYFSRMFARRMGVPPARYRRLQTSSLGRRPA